MEEIQLHFQDLVLSGILSVPKGAKGIVLFSHGSGSGRLSPRNQFVASTLNNRGLATLLFDLLTEDEEEVDQITRQLRFDIPLLSDRLVHAIDWVYRKYPELSIGLFGSSTGAASALIAAHFRNKIVKCVVSRGGRPDLAGDFLPKVTAPTLLIVGGEDFGVIDLNQMAKSLMHAEVALEIVPGATHLFEEEGTLETVARLAGDWFLKYL